MEKPNHQIVIEIIGWTLVGVIATGVLLDAVSNAITLINIRIASVITGILIIVAVLFDIVLKSRKIKWKALSNDLITISGLSKRVKWKIFGSLLLIWFAAIFNYSKSSSQIEDKTKSRQIIPLFDSTSKRFKILILPFDRECDYEGIKYDIGLVITRRLARINQEDSLNLEIKYLSDTTGFSNLEANSAYSIMKQNFADQIIYGFYSLKQCEGNGLNKICFNYQTDSSKLLIKHKSKKENYDPISIGGLESLRNGTGQEDIDYVIYLFATASALEYNDHLKAIRLIKKVKDYEINEPFAQTLGQCYQILKDYKKSTSTFEKLLMHKPKSFLAWSGISFNYIQLKNYTKALESLKKSISINSNYDITWANMGFVYDQQNNKQKAIECYQKAIEINPRNVISIISLADLFMERKNFLLAKNLYEKAKDLDSTNSNNWLMLGMSYGGFGNHEAAKECFLKCLKLDPFNSNALTKLGMLYYHHLKEQKTAETYFYKAIKVDSTFFLPLNYLGQISLNRRDFEKSKAFFLKALKLNPDHDASLVSLAVCYLNTNEYDNGKKYLLKAQKLIGRNASISYNMSAINSLEKNKLIALKYLKEAISMNNSLKITAQRDSAFKWIWLDPAFIKIVR